MTRLRLTIDFSDDPDIGYEELQAAFDEISQQWQFMMDAASNGVSGELAQSGSKFNAIAYDATFPGFHLTAVELHKCLKQMNGGSVQVKAAVGESLKFIVVAALDDEAEAIAQFVDSRSSDTEAES